MNEMKWNENTACKNLVTEIKFPRIERMKSEQEAPEKTGLKRMPSPDQRFVHDHAVSRF